jgi:hypothetical protein
MLCLSACRGRVTASQTPTADCIPRCGGVTNVIKDLPQGTPLTTDECAEACSVLWCGKSPASAGKPGCSLGPKDDIGQPTVTCGPALPDCP